MFVNHFDLFDAVSTKSIVQISQQKVSKNMLDFAFNCERCTFGTPFFVIEERLPGVVSRALWQDGRGQKIDSFLKISDLTGLADPYLLVSLDGTSQQTLAKISTLEPVWNEKMQVRL